MRISDWISDLCSSDLDELGKRLVDSLVLGPERQLLRQHVVGRGVDGEGHGRQPGEANGNGQAEQHDQDRPAADPADPAAEGAGEARVKRAGFRPSQAIPRRWRPYSPGFARLTTGPPRSGPRDSTNNLCFCNGLIRATLTTASSIRSYGGYAT